MQEDRNELLAGDPQGSRMRRMQMRDAHRIGPVAMDLGVDAPLQRNEPARMLDDGAVEIEDENIFRAHCALVGAGARADEKRGWCPACGSRYVRTFRWCPAS